MLDSRVLRALATVGSTPFFLGILVTTLVVAGEKCGTETVDFTSSSTTGTAGDGGSGGEAGSGGSGGDETGSGGAGGETSTASSSATGGGGGSGGTGAGGTGGSGGTIGTGGTGTGGGGGPVAGCDPVSPSGNNCAEDVCGTIESYGASSSCDKQCSGEGSVFGVGGAPSEISWVFAPAVDQGCPAACWWSFVVRVPDKGCVRVTSSEGLHVSTQYAATVCGVPSEVSCLVAESYGGNPSDHLRIVATADATVEAGWLRIETMPGTCAASGYTCN